MGLRSSKGFSNPNQPVVGNAILPLPELEGVEVIQGLPGWGGHLPARTLTLAGGQFVGRFLLSSSAGIVLVGVSGFRCAKKRFLIEFSGWSKFGWCLDQVCVFSLWKFA